MKVGFVVPDGRAVEPELKKSQLFGPVNGDLPRYTLIFLVGEAEGVSTKAK